MDKAVLLTAIIILSTSSLTQAQEDELSDTLSFTYMSKTIVAGYGQYLGPMLVYFESDIQILKRATILLISGKTW